MLSGLWQRISPRLHCARARLGGLRVDLPTDWREISPDSATALFNLMIVGAVHSAAQPPPEIVITAADALRYCTALAGGPPIDLDSAEVWRRIDARWRELGETCHALCGLPDRRGAVNVCVRKSVDDRYFLRITPAKALPGSEARDAAETCPYCGKPPSGREFSKQRKQ